MKGFIKKVLPPLFIFMLSVLFTFIATWFSLIHRVDALERQSIINGTDHDSIAVIKETVNTVKEDVKQIKEYLMNSK